MSLKTRPQSTFSLFVVLVLEAAWDSFWGWLRRHTKPLAELTEAVTDVVTPGCSGCQEAHQLMVGAPECPLPRMCGEHAAWSRQVGLWARARGLA